MVFLCFYCAHHERKLQNSVKFQLETLSLFCQPQPELVLKLFLIFGQYEPHCSYEAVIKKGVRTQTASLIEPGFQQLANGDFSIYTDFFTLLQSYLYPTMSQKQNDLCNNFGKTYTLDQILSTNKSFIALKYAKQDRSNQKNIENSWIG